MEEKKQEAVNYAVDSNKLEEHNITDSEVKEILQSLEKTDESFLNAVVDYVKQANNENGENDVKVRK